MFIIRRAEHAFVGAKANVSAVHCQKFVSQNVGHGVAASARKIGLGTELRFDHMDTFASVSGIVQKFARSLPKYRHRVPMLFLDRDYGYEGFIFHY